MALGHRDLFQAVTVSPGLSVEDTEVKAECLFIVSPFWVLGCHEVTVCHRQRGIACLHFVLRERTPLVWASKLDPQLNLHLLYLINVFLNSVC